MELLEIKQKFFAIDQQLVNLANSIDNETVKKMILDFTEDDLDYLEYKIEEILK